MYIDRVPNRTSPPAILLREGIREGGKVHKRTLANLTCWPDEKVVLLEKLLRGEKLVPESDFKVMRTLPHGHVRAVMGTMRKLGMAELLSATPCREREIVLGLIAQRVLQPDSKLAMTRLWKDSTLSEELSLADVDTDAVYDAMDWVLLRQSRVEKKLAGRHLQEGSVALYDLSSSYYYGQHCPLAKYGHDRDHKGLPIIEYGLLTNLAGIPCGISVYEGGTSDSTTVPDQVEKLRSQWGLSRIVLVGDRGMLIDTQIEHLRGFPGLAWVSALVSKDIQDLRDEGLLQTSLFDRDSLAEISSPEYPDERLVVCYNQALGEDRRQTRQELLAATEHVFTRISNDLKRRTKTPLTKDEVGVRVGRVIDKYKMAKHFELTITDNHFEWTRKAENIEREAQLDGFYVIRTNVSSTELSSEDVVRTYKRLSEVEQAFRTLKSLDMQIRPIHHRIPERVRAHIFICMLAYYVAWHMRRALAPLLFEDADVEQSRKTRHPVAPAKPTDSAKDKRASKTTPEGLPVHSFYTLMTHLATHTRGVYAFDSWNATPSGKTHPLTTRKEAELTEVQAEAFRLLGLCSQ